MEFYIEKHSSVPVIAQIEEQIKLAVTMGIFRYGDKLPSIREIEKQTGVNRGKIYRAYLSLRQSGLVVLAQGRGAVVAAPALSDHSTSRECSRLSASTLQKARQCGIPPTVFARYLSRQAQEMERNEPFLAFVDEVKQVAEGRAEEISGLWQVAVTGMTVLHLKAALRKGLAPQKILANHLTRDYIRSLISDKGVDVIPVEVVYSEQTVEDLAGIKANASVLRILAQPYVKYARFIVAQLQKWIRAPGVRISWISVHEVSSMKNRLNGLHYDRIILDSGILNAVPDALRKAPQILLVRLQLSPPSLEAARIRAGVII